MSAKAIREFDGKKILATWLENPSNKFSTSKKIVKIDENTRLDDLEVENPWLLTDKLVAKPDQLIKRRGKSGLLLLNADWQQAKAWITERRNKEIDISGVTGVLRSFIVEPFVPHAQSDEYYVCIQSTREGDEILFYHEGGVDIGDVDSKAERLSVAVSSPMPSTSAIEKQLLSKVPISRHGIISSFIHALFNVYVELHFTYLEINPFVVTENPNGGAALHYLDLAAKLDQTAEYEVGPKWLGASFPAPFGRDLTKEEAYIQDLDSKTGASLKLTILNKDGRIWTMVAGGGASVAYSDAIANLGFAHELANYGEYSGAPSEAQTYEYSKTILDLMTRGEPRVEGKILIIGGGIANFTNVAATFKGIVTSLKEYQHRLINHKVKIYVRRGGPNYQEGLRVMRTLGDSLGVPIHVYGPETHITSIVPLALLGENTSGPTSANKEDVSFTEQLFTDTVQNAKAKRPSQEDITQGGPLRGTVEQEAGDQVKIEYFQKESSDSLVQKPWYSLFSSGTRAFVFGMQPKAVQGMLDFDHICKRKNPSVAAMIYPFGGSHLQKFYWGTSETLLPVFTSIKEACAKFPDVDVVVNFASFRSVYESTMEILDYPQIRTVAIIAEGVPERKTKAINRRAKECDVTIIGPATVGGIKPGCFKIGNTGGMIDNIVSSKLYRSGSVAYVSKSGGMSNELNNIIGRLTDGVYEGVAIGGDRYPGTTFIDHILRFQADPVCKLIVLLGEVGGVEEYKVIEAVKSGKITKPVIAWCIGTCAKMFATEVQFGHAGALANSDLETADAKNNALRAGGIIVPETFEDLPNVLAVTYRRLVSEGFITPTPEPETPKIPIDYSWAQELGLVRKPAHFVSTICDDRGQELLYAGMTISEVFKENIGIGGVVSLLWFKRRLPEYATKFVEMVLMLTADHGPAVSGAHNCIVTARAGKDLVSSLTSGLLTIGERFGGALDGAAAQFSAAYDQGLSPQQFVEDMRKRHQLILGIGHRIKSKTNPDLRVSIIKDFARKNFPTTSLLDYALEVEKLTTAKRDNLILNVDGAVGVLFVDLLRGCGAFSREEADEYTKIGTLNGLFVLGRSIGFIGHYLDQIRLKQGLYRHPWDDISYLTPSSGI